MCTALEITTTTVQDEAQELAAYRASEKSKERALCIAAGLHSDYQTLPQATLEALALAALAIVGRPITFATDDKQRGITMRGAQRMTETPSEAWEYSGEDQDHPSNCMVSCHKAWPVYVTLVAALLA